jgi:hypothetical protein
MASLYLHASPGRLRPRHPVPSAMAHDRPEPEELRAATGQLESDVACRMLMLMGTGHTWKSEGLRTSKEGGQEGAWTSEET